MSIDAETALLGGHLLAEAFDPFAVMRLSATLDVWMASPFVDVETAVVVDALFPLPEIPEPPSFTADHPAAARASEPDEAQKTAERIVTGWMTTVALRMYRVPGADIGDFGTMVDEASCLSDADRRWMMEVARRSLAVRFPKPPVSHLWFPVEDPWTGGPAVAVYPVVAKRVLAAPPLVVDNMLEWLGFDRVSDRVLAVPPTVDDLSGLLSSLAVERAERDEVRDLLFGGASEPEHSSSARR